LMFFRAAAFCRLVATIPPLCTISLAGLTICELAAWPARSQAAGDSAPGGFPFNARSVRQPKAGAGSHEKIGLGRRRGRRGACRWNWPIGESSALPQHRPRARRRHRRRGPPLLRHGAGGRLTLPLMSRKGYRTSEETDLVTLKKQGKCPAVISGTVRCSIRSGQRTAIDPGLSSCCSRALVGEAEVER
jgi:hypothetical protein